MLEEAHRALLVSWESAGDEVSGAEDHVPEAVVARAWSCSCGWWGEVRAVDGRFFCPRGDVGGRLRSARVRRDDRRARAAWDVHVGGAGPGCDKYEAAPDSDAERDGDEPESRGAVAPQGPREVDAGGVEGSGAGRVPLVRSARAERARLRQLGLAGAVSRAADAAADSRASVPSTVPAAPTGSSSAASRPAEAIALAANRVSAARAEVVTADAVLASAVRAAREQGLSWRAIAAAAGLDHRVARARWAPDSEAGALP